MDLQNLFSAMLNMTITGSVVIGCVLAARLALRRAPRVFSYALWAVVLFRLLCPVSVSGPVSVLSAVDAPEQFAPVGAVVYLPSPVSAPSETLIAEPEQTVSAAPAVDTEPADIPVDWHMIASRLWAVGAMGFVICGLISYVNLKRRLWESVPLGTGIREADGIGTAFVLGFFRPVIYLPTSLREEERGYILLHEQYHLRHGDHLVKALFFAAVCIHWFNPLVHLAFRLCCRDMELRCDEAVLKQLGPQVRSDYAQSLLNLAAHGHMAPAPLAFGEGDTGKRVKFVLGWKRNKLWAAIPAAALCIAVLILTACNPGGDPYGEQYLFNRNYRAEAVLGDGSELPEQIYELWEYDQSLHLRVGTDERKLTGLERKSLSGFDLTDDALEKTLREENLCAWRFTDADGWLLRQEDLSVWLVFGNDTVLRLDPTDRVSTGLKGNAGPTPEPVSYYTSGPDDILERLLGMTLTGPETLVFKVNSDDTELTVLEEYHDLQSGREIIKQQTHTLTRTRDYGFELPVEGKPGDYAIYRVELGLSTYVFRVNFAGSEVKRAVTYAEAGAYITLNLPEDWTYEITSLADNESSAGIVFRPPNCEGGLRFEYYPQRFGVCGTGLEVAAKTLGSYPVGVGTYDGRELWDFISFGERFAVWGEGHESWWAEYGDAAMDILAAAKFGDDRVKYASFRGANDYDQSYELAQRDGAYVHLWVQNLDPDLHCYVRINDGERLLLNPGESGWATAEVSDGEYQFRCTCDIGGVNVNVRIIQTDSETPIG